MALRGFGDGSSGDDPAVYQFGDVVLDSRAFKVLKAGRPVHLEPKAVELLLLLVRRPGRLVTKAEIQAEVWKDTAVTENALTRLVAQIRREIGDDAREARYLETVPTRGYRFVAEVRLESAPGGAPWSREEGREERRTARPLAVALVALAGLATLALWRIRNQGPSETVLTPEPLRTETQQRQVSTGSSLNVDPTFSPDGSTLAYSAERDGSMEIVVRPLAPGAREVEVTADGRQNVNPAWSPDGRFIAYHSVARGGIWIVPALGGVPRALSTFGSNPAWSPDGQTLVFQSQAWVAQTEDSPAAGDGSTLFLVDSAGGAPRRLTAVDAVAGSGRGGHGRPRWAPDGRRIAFVAGGGVWTVQPDGSDIRPLGRHGRVLDVEWTRDGGAQIWTGQFHGNWYVRRVPLDPSTGAPTGVPEVLASGGASSPIPRLPALSPDGRQLAYVTFRTGYQLLSLPVDAEGRAKGEPRPLAPHLAPRKISPAFDPTGRILAFSLWQPGQGTSLWTLSVDEGDEPRPAMTRERGEPWGSFFPDGTRVLTSSWDQDSLGVVEVDLDSGRETELLRLPHAFTQLQLSPDGQMVTMHAPAGGTLQVWVASLPRGTPRQITHEPGGAGWPAWSPDARSLAVELLRETFTQVGIVPVGGGTPRALTAPRGQSWPYSFSPDGRRIAFAGQRDGLWNVYWTAVVTGEERRLTSYTSPALYVRYPAWSPRGDRIVFEYAESSSTVWTTEVPAPVTPRAP